MSRNTTEEEVDSTNTTTESEEEVKPSTQMIVDKINPITNIIRQLIQQQQKIIELIEEIAPKKAIVTSEGPSTPTTERLSEVIRRRRLKLYRAALNGDWEEAKRIYDVHKDEVKVEISKHGYTALHIAAAAGHVDFVKELMKMIDDDDVLSKQDKSESTALSFAAASRKVELAQEMMKNKKSLAMVPDKNGTLPIYMAAAVGHKDMVEYFRKERGFSLTEEQRTELFVSLTEAKLYDVALELLRKDPYLATARARNEETALHVLARKHLSISGRFLNLCARNVKSKRLQALELVELIWEKVVLFSDSEISSLIAEPRDLIFDAVKRGNVEFLSILICGYPDLIWKVNSTKNYYTIFHFAVKHRQEDIFKLIHEIGSSKEILLILKDQDDNNILHLAGYVAAKVELNIVSGAALQMQRELLWFKRVEKLVQPMCVESRNKEGFTPRELFTKEHEDLRDKGEKWMKDTAGSCLVVAALIATVAFAAAITVPGGNNGDTGFPIFLDKVSFKIFAISDAISLIFSSASIVDFLSILTSRYAEEDFLKKLPTKLLIGLGTLFLSIAAMMVVFSTAFFIFFNNGRLWIPILITVIASIPVIMFIGLHFQLFYDVLRSTYPSDSFLNKGKKSLFRKEEEESYQRRQKILNAHLKFQCTCSTNV